ncbi:MAG: sulfate adenylyltransferase [Deltaproteobacteria bacterium]|nr:sulfate adenylyltransferase [Deltaproteobacteria bacterium]
MPAIAPHGGKLISRILTGSEREKALTQVSALPKIVLNSRERSDLDMIACGALSPLEGFMGQKEYENVVEKMRLLNGLAWTIPITLAVKKEDSAKYEIGKDIALFSPSPQPSPLKGEGAFSAEGEILAILHLQEKFEPNKKNEALKVYKTEEGAHPGVAAVYAQGEVYLAGKVSVLNRVQYDHFLQYRLDPAQLRALFAEKKWKRVVGFQTRNPIHRAHEYLTKCALEIVDGLLIHPLVGDTKSDDIPAEVRMKCYEKLIENYYPANRTQLAVNPAAMRYAGPREAIFHALIRQNYGCSHFIVGRDHAGVGNYYGTFDAHFIFENFNKEELAITPLFFDHTFYCKKCEGMASTKTCPHDKENHVALSGTKVRELLSKGELPPPEFSRPEVARILIESMRK